MSDLNQDPLSALQQIEATLSADWQKFVAFIQQVEANFAAFLVKVAAGEQVVAAEVDAVAAGVAGKLTTINAGIASVGTLAAAVAPNDTAVQKVLSDLAVGAQDVADLHVALTTGITTNDPTVVTQAATAINAANELAQLVSSAAASVGTTAASSPTATQAVSSPTPAGG